MAFLAGPGVPIEAALVQLTRSHRAEPFGLEVSPSGLSPVEMAIMQLVGLMNRLMGIIEHMAATPRLEPEDDFMRGWGEPGGDIES